MKEANFYFSERSVSPLLIREFRRLKDRNSIVLDDGCGDGVMLKDLSDLKLLGIRIHAIDISKKNIAIAKKRNLKVDFRVADAQKLPFKNSFFDLIYSWMVIEHVPDMEAMVSEIRRVLKKGKHCYISSVLKLPWGIYFYRNNGKFVLDPTHLYEFRSDSEFQKLFTKSGLRMIRYRKEIAKYALIELIIKILIRLRIIKPTIELREIFTKNKLLAKIREVAVIPIPGFYHIEGVFEKS